mmetsp:Transcript_106220/g.298687  ORF Transcript_106220/g.298687 Transcript_106220/m.298687 type:complete len:270 (-) Transcript_106220:705-1514(-)
MYATRSPWATKERTTGLRQTTGGARLATTAIVLGAAYFSIMCPSTPRRRLCVPSSSALGRSATCVSFGAAMDVLIVGRVSSISYPQPSPHMHFSCWMGGYGGTAPAIAYGPCTCRCTMAPTPEDAPSHEDRATGMLAVARGAAMQAFIALMPNLSSWRTGSRPLAEVAAPISATAIQKALARWAVMGSPPAWQVPCHPHSRQGGVAVDGCARTSAGQTWRILSWSDTHGRPKLAGIMRHSLWRRRSRCPGGADWALRWLQLGHQRQLQR